MPSLFVESMHPDEESIGRFNNIKNKLKNNIVFNPKDDDHIKLINDSSAYLKNKLAVLKSLDQRIVAGFVLSAAAFGVSFILPIVTIAIIGLVFSVYCLLNRMHESKEYRRALMAVEGCMEWTLAALPQNKGQAQEVIKCPAVVTMFKTAAPLMSNQQLIDIIDDKFEDIFVEQAGILNQTRVENFLGHRLTEEEKTIEYGIYGFQKGKPLDILEGLVKLARKGWHAAQKAVSNMNKDSRPEAEPARIAP